MDSYKELQIVHLGLGHLLIINLMCYCAWGYTRTSTHIKEKYEFKEFKNLEFNVHLTIKVTLIESK